MATFRMPLRFLRGGMLRMLPTIIALASGVALVCAIDLANRAVYAAFSDILDTMAGRAALQITAGNGALFPEDVATIVGSVAGVELAVPVVSSWAFTTGATAEQLTVHGIDITNDAAIRTYEPAGRGPDLDDALAFLNQRDSIMLTESFAARLGIRREDAIELDTPTGRRRFVVRGLLAPTGVARAQGGNVLVMDIASAEVAFTQRGFVNRVDVVVRDGADLPAVRDTITGSLPPGLRVEAPEHRRLDLHRVLSSTQMLLRAVSLFGLFAAFLIAFSRLSTVFESRVTQLALLRAVGVRTTRVWWELIKESALVAVAGIAVGIPAGIGLGHAILPVVATATSISAKLMTADAVVTVRLQSIVLAAVLGLAAVVLAAIVPARRAAALPVIATLRHRQYEDDPDGDRTLAAVALIAVGVAGLGIAVHVVLGDAASGLVASALTIVAVTLATRPLLVRLAPFLTALGPRVGGAMGRYAVATLLRNPRRTAVTVATLGIGFGTVIWLWTLGGSFEESVVEVIPTVLRGDLAVSSANVAAGYVEAPLDDAILDELRAVPDVHAVAGEQTADWHYAEGPIAIDAFDAAYFGNPAFGRWRLVGRALPGALDAAGRGTGVLVSENFVHNVGQGVGDVVTLQTPSGPMSIRIVGVLASFLSPRGTVLMSRELYRRLWRDSHLTHALIDVRDGASVDDVRTRIMQVMGAKYRLRVLPIHALVEWFAAQARRAFLALDVLAAVILIVVLVGVGDAIAAGMMERVRELGVLRAIGVRRHALGRMILAEGLVLGMLGLAAAVVLGLGLGSLWVKTTFPALLGWTLSLYVPFRHLCEIAVVTIVVCLLAAYLPAARAARLDPVEALRTE